MAEYIGVEIDEYTPEFMSRLRKYFVKRWMDGCQNITYMNSLNSVFIEVDVEGSNYINALEFRRYVQKCIPDIPNKDCRRMFMSFDRCSNGYLDFNGFEKKMTPPKLDGKRLKIVTDIFNIKDVNKSKTLTVEDFITKSDAKNNKNIKHFVEDVLIGAYNKGSSAVTFTEFLQYFTDASLYFKDDNEFEIFVFYKCNMD